MHLADASPNPIYRNRLHCRQRDPHRRQFAFCICYNPVVAIALIVDMIPKKITFRLTDAEAKKLYYSARDKGISPHLLARDIVIDGLSMTAIGERIEALGESLEELRILSQGEIRTLRIAVVQGLAVLLAKQEGVGKEDAVEWLENKIKYGVD